MARPSHTRKAAGALSVPLLMSCVSLSPFRRHLDLPNMLALLMVLPMPCAISGRDRPKNITLLVHVSLALSPFGQKTLLMRCGPVEMRPRDSALSKAVCRASHRSLAMRHPLKSLACDSLPVLCRAMVLTNPEHS